MKGTAKPRARIYLALGLLLLVVLVACTAIGSVSIPLASLFKILVSPVLNTAGDILAIPALESFGQGIPETWQTVVLRLRLPRVLVAMLAGSALSLAGGTMQGLFKNPLADPYIVGVSSGAAVGAAAAMLFGLGWTLLGTFAIPLAAFAGGIGSLVLVYSLASSGGRLSTLSLLLAGVAVSTFLGALVSLIVFFSGQQLQQVVFWMMGGFTGRTWIHVLSVLPFLLGGGAIIFWHSRELDALAMGDEQAHYMGVDVERVKRRLLWASALLTAAAVSVSGLIGFVGLVIFSQEQRTKIPSLGQYIIVRRYCHDRKDHHSALGAQTDPT